MTTCKLEAQNVLSFLPHRIRSLHQGYFPDLIDQQSTLSADRYSCQRNSFSAESTCRLHAVVSMTLCAVWRKQTSARSSRPMKIGQHRMTTGSRKPGVFIKTAHHENNNDNKNNDNNNKQEIAANYEKYIRARDPLPWWSIHQNLNSLGNSFCSDSNLAGASLCRNNFCTWQVWHETHIYALKACAKFVLMTRKWNTTKWNFNHTGNVHYSDVIMSAMAS